MFKFTQKFISSPTLNKQRTYSYITNNKDKQTQNSSPLFYSHFGFPSLSLKEGLKKVDWFLENEKYSPYSGRRNIPNWFDLKFLNASSPAFQLLADSNCINYISSLNIQPGLAKSQFFDLDWNPNMLKIYLDIILTETKKKHLFGKPYIRKSKNLAFLSLLIKAFPNEKYRVFLLHNPKAWNKENFAFQLLEELKLSFGEELMNKNHKDHSKAVEIFEEFDRLLNKANSEFKYQDYSVQQILSLIKKELLTGKELIFLFDQAEAMPKEYESNKEDPIKSIVEPLMNISNTSILVESITNKVIPSETKKEQGEQFIFDLKMSKKNAKEFMEQSCKETNEKIAEKLSQRDINLALNHYTGYYPGSMNDFVKCLIETKNFDEALLKYQNQQVDEISKQFDNFVNEKVRKEGRDAKELIIDNAYEISNQLKEYGFFSTKFVNLDYVDLRYFREEKEGLYPLNMYITKYYADNYLLSERYYKNHVKKTNQLNELKDQVRCEFKRLIIQCLIEEEEDIEIGCKGDYQKIYKEKVVASLNPKITLKDNEKILGQIPDIDSCPKFFDCIVLNEEEKQIFLLTFEKKLSDFYIWYLNEYCDESIEEYEAIVNQEGFKLFKVITYPDTLFKYDDYIFEDLKNSEGFYNFFWSDLKSYDNLPY